MALTGRKRVFADAILAGLTNKKAAIKAGYSAATASPAGSRLVKEKAVAEYLAAKRSASVESMADPMPPTSDDPTYDADPKAFLLKQMNDPGLEMRFRIDVAKALMPFDHFKKGEGGKKDVEQDKARKAAGGKFAPAAPPKLVAAGGKKI